jgi:hypothetical protein
MSLQEIVYTLAAASNSGYLQASIPTSNFLLYQTGPQPQRSKYKHSYFKVKIKNPIHYFQEIKNPTSTPEHHRVGYARTQLQISHSALKKLLEKPININKQTNT